MMGVMIQTAFLVIAILTVQKLLGNKLHAYVRYRLWLLVALRLMIPVNFIDSPLSVLQIAETIRLPNAAEHNAGLEKTDFERKEDAINGQEVSSENILQSANVETGAGNILPIESTENTEADAENIGATADRETDNTRRADDEDRKESDTARKINTKHIQSAVTEAYLSGTVSKLFHLVWLIGSLFVGGFLGLSHFLFRQRLRKSREVYTKDLPNIKKRASSLAGFASQTRYLIRKFRGISYSITKETLVPVYRVKGLEIPCLVGPIRPAIYIGTDIDTDTDYFRYTITHEEVHYLHRDHVWAFVRAALVVVYWFHPFVWIAAVFSARDGEIACDYGTVRRLGSEERFAYGEMLLSLSKIQRGKKVYSYGTMLRSGKSELKSRILRLTQVGGSRVWAGALAALLMVIMVGCAFTGAVQKDGDKEFLTVNEANEDTTNTAADDDGDNIGVDTGDIQDEKEESDEKVNLSDNEDTYNMEPRQLEAESAEITGETPFGADGPYLDYAGGMGTDRGSRIIFHDYFGLIVYDLDNREITRSLDLSPIGCDKTQGDDACQVAVSEDGATVWLHPMSKRYMYRYEVEENLLFQEPLVKTFELDLETKELFDRYSTSEEKSTYWHSNYLYEEYKDVEGLHEAYIYLYVYNTQDDFGSELVLRNLECSWDDMMFKLFEDFAEVQGDTEIPEEDQGSTDIPEEIKHERFQDNQTDEESETANTDGFPYNYNGGVKDVEIKYDKPCNYTRISGAFGGRVHPITGEVTVHDGIDFAAAEGTDVTAAAEGVVYETGYSAKYGNYVVLLHVNGDMTYYCQCKEVIVKKDDQVKRGDKIATVGKTGQATGPHLHFALSRSGWFVNPESYMEIILDLN